MYFKENVGKAMLCAPDKYPAWDVGAYPTHRSELLRHWQDAKALLKKDFALATDVDNLLGLALQSLDLGQREPGHSLMVELYNLLNLNALQCDDLVHAGRQHFSAVLPVGGGGWACGGRVFAH
jgi:hypothetical protein